MKPILHHLLAIAIIIIVSSCATTTDVTPPTNASKSELLAGEVSKSWLLSASFVNGKDVTQNWEACTKDDLLVFRRDNSYERNEGTLKCSNKDLQVYDKGYWEFDSGQANIVLNKNKTYKIVTLTANTLVISTKNIWGEIEEFAYKPI